VRYKRVIVSRSGGPEVLRVIEEDVPEPGPSEARVKILAAGVSYADLLMREGVHPEARRTPFTPGWDLVGVVDGLGEGVSTVEVGQMVAALPVRGGYAEFICLPQEELVPVPAGLDAGEAVSLVWRLPLVALSEISAGRRKGGGLWSYLDITRWETVGWATLPPSWLGDYRIVLHHHFLSPRQEKDAALQHPEIEEAKARMVSRRSGHPTGIAPRGKNQTNHR
jgi:hypothetical protein